MRDMDRSAFLRFILANEGLVLGRHGFLRAGQLVVVLRILAVDLPNGNRHIETFPKKRRERCKFIMIKTPI
jgi:hypothetical protein